MGWPEDIFFFWQLHWVFWENSLGMTTLFHRGWPEDIFFFRQLHSDFRETTQSLWPEDTLLADVFQLQGNSIQGDLKPPFWEMHSDFRDTAQRMTWSHPSGSCILTSGKQHNDAWSHLSGSCILTSGTQHEGWPEATLLEAAFWLQGHSTKDDLKTPFWQLHSDFRDTALRMTWRHLSGSCILTSGKQHNYDLKPPFWQLHSDFRETTQWCLKPPFWQLHSDFRDTALRMTWSPVPDDGTLTSSCSMREMLGIVPSRFMFTSILEKVRSPMTTSCGRCPRMMLRNSWWRRYRSFHCFFSRAYVSAGTDFLQGLEDKSVGETTEMAGSLQHEMLWKNV